MVFRKSGNMDLTKLNEKQVEAGNHLYHTFKKKKQLFNNQVKLPITIFRETSKIEFSTFW